MRYEDYDWFLDNMRALYKKYGGKIAVVKDKSILSVYGDLSEAINATMENKQMEVYLVQKIYENKDKIPLEFMEQKLFKGLDPLAKKVYK